MAQWAGAKENQLREQCNDCVWERERERGIRGEEDKNNCIIYTCHSHRWCLNLEIISLVRVPDLLWNLIFFLLPQFGSTFAYQVYAALAYAHPVNICVNNLYSFFRTDSAIDLPRAVWVEVARGEDGAQEEGQLGFPISISIALFCGQLARVN